jgi:hypothetical protein
MFQSFYKCCSQNKANGQELHLSALRCVQLMMSVFIYEEQENKNCQLSLKEFGAT